jgi:hypothetical protein
MRPKLASYALMLSPYARGTGALPRSPPKDHWPFGNPFFVSIQQVVAICSSMIRGANH